LKKGEVRMFSIFQRKKWFFKQKFKKREKHFQKNINF